MKEKLIKQIEFLTEVDKMKSILRQTMLIDKSRQETDAEHSWHFALTALTLFEYASSDDVDINRVIKMALIHDLVEIYAGDTFAYDVKGNESKEQREKESADKLFSMLPNEQGLEFRSIWEEFEQMQTSDAMYANAIDRLQPFINNYKTNGHSWVLHKVTVENVYKRMLPIKTALPELWEYIEMAIKDCCEKGYITEQEVTL